MRAPDAEAFAAGAVDWDAGAVGDADAARFGELAAAAASPIDDHRATRGLPPPGHRGARPPAAAAGVRQRRRRTGIGVRPMSEHYSLHVNGAAHDVADAWLGESLLYVLRERLGLLGAKGACEQGECGSCSVLVDGELVCSCLVLAASAVGLPIVTIEGLAEPGAPTDVQRAFVDAGAVQCGFCTPGLVMAAHALLDRSPHRRVTEIREQLSGNICRCTGYGRLIAAVQQVAVDRTAERRREPVTTSTDVAPHGSRDRRRPDRRTRRSRPTGSPRPRARFAFSSDLPIDGRLWGATLRSPHPYARIVSIDTSTALGDHRRARRSSPPTTCPARRPTG